jgi:hypothetical protein
MKEEVLKCRDSQSWTNGAILELGHKRNYIVTKSKWIKRFVFKSSALILLANGIYVCLHLSDFYWTWDYQGSLQFFTTSLRFPGLPAMFALNLAWPHELPAMPQFFLGIGIFFFTTEYLQVMFYKHHKLHLSHQAVLRTVQDYRVGKVRC